MLSGSRYVANTALVDRSGTHMIAKKTTFAHGGPKNIKARGGLPAAPEVKLGKDGRYRLFPMHTSHPDAKNRPSFMLYDTQKNPGFAKTALLITQSLTPW